MNKPAIHKLSILAAALALTGCAGFQANQSSVTEQKTLRENEAARANSNVIKQRSVARPRGVVEDVDTPYTGGHEVILAAKSTQWPASLRRDTQVDMWFSDNVSDSNGNVIIPISDFAQKVHLVTGVPVRVKPDSLIDENKKPIAVTIPSKYKGSLVPLFEQLASRYRVHAQYQNGELEFFRMTTRRFMIGAAAASSGGSMTIDSGGGEGGFNTTASLKSTFLEVDVSKTLVAGLKQWMSKDAPEPVYNGATGSLTVTDTPEALDRIGEYIDSESRLLRRGIIFDVDVIRFSNSNKGQSGVNWQLVYQRVKELNSTVTNLASPAGALAGAAGLLGAQIQPGEDGQNRFAGSSALVAALNERGNAAVVRRVMLETVNRVGVMHAINKTFDYVNETSASTSLSGVAAGQKTKQENVGRTLMLVPAINTDSEATVDISIRESTRNPFGRNVSGSGQSQTTVQLLDKDTEVARQRVTLSNGESRVLAAISGRTSEGSNQTLDEHLSALFGGTISGNKAEDQYYLVVTMRFKE